MKLLSVKFKEPVSMPGTSELFTYYGPAQGCEMTLEQGIVWLRKGGRVKISPKDNVIESEPVEVNDGRARKAP